MAATAATASRLAAPAARPARSLSRARPAATRAAPPSSRRQRIAPRRRCALHTTAALSPEAARAAVDAAVRGDASGLAAATGHAVNAAANIGIPDVSLFLLCVAAPPVALAVRFGSQASLAILATSALMVLPTLALLTRGSPSKARDDVAPVPLLCLLAAEGIALARCFVFTGGVGML
jgi:hypothetical protein